MAKYPFQNISKRWKSLRPRLPKIITEVAINDFEENFRRGGYINGQGKLVKWKPRQPTKGDNDRGVLIGKGSAHMMKDFHNRANFNFAKAINKTPYAEVHQKGLTLRGKKRRFVGYTKRGNPKYERTGERAKMPARPFMVTSKLLLNKIEAEAFKEIDNLLRGL